MAIRVRPFTTRLVSVLVLFITPAEEPNGEEDDALAFDMFSSRSKRQL